MSKDNVNLKASLKVLLSCDSSRRVFNTLVAVRKLVSKDKNGVADVLSACIIPKIIEILGREDPESDHTSTADVVLSILGNMAMDVRARLAICQAGGIKTVANHFLKTKVASIQLRSCRTLANLALDVENIRVIAECDVFPQTIKLLQEAKDKDFIFGCCRALRLFGQTSAERKKLIGHGAILSLSKQLKKDDKQIVTSSLRTLFELSISGCSPSFAQQVLDANILEKLVSLVDDSDATTSHSALSLLLRLTDIPDVRPSIGAAGGIPLLIKLMTDERTHVNKIFVINALCLCGKEAVNRIKIRELGGLQMFLTSLQDEFYSTVHDRLISGLVCFHYDDDSIDILLDNDLVHVLLKHLQRSASFISVPERLDVNKRKKVTDDQHKDVSSPMEPLCGICEEIVGGSKSRLVDDSPSFAIKQKDEQIEKVAEADQEKQGTSCNHVFSIDSPTYTISTEWTMDNESTSSSNRQRLTTPTALSPQSSKAPYSPLSNESIVSSPSMSSTQFSPPSSPSLTTNPLDIEMYGPIGSKSYMCGSPQPKFSPLGWSPPDCHGSDSVSSWHYSSEEEEDWEEECDSPDLCVGVSALSRMKADTTVDEDTSIKISFGCKPGKSHDGDNTKQSQMKEEMKVCENVTDASFVSQSVKKYSGDAAFIHLGHRNLNKLKSSNIVDHEMCVKPIIYDGREDSVDLFVWKGKRTVSLRSPESQKLDLTENIPKRTKTDTKKTDILKTTEKNILILLSRISVKTDPSPFLIVNPVLSCLLDYLTLSSNPQSRCIRTLSRLLRNPHCLEPLLRICAPAFIYKNLLLNDKGIDTSAYQLFNRKKIERRRTWTPQGSDSSFSISYDMDLAKYMLVADPQLPSPTRMEQDFDLDSSVSASRHNCSSEDWVIDVPGTGLNLLKDLSFSAASPFGRGVISHILLRKEENVQILCSVCLLYLCWSPGMQQHYLIKLKVVDRMLSLLQSESLGPLFSAVLCGLVFLVKMVDRPSTLKQTVTKDSFRSVYFKSDVADVGPSPMKETVTTDCKSVCVKSVVVDDKSSAQKNTGTGDTVCMKSVVDSTSSCHYKTAHFDLFFTSDKKRIGSNRETLIKNSSVFSAMLEGHYTEASQSEITMPCTSHDALLYVLHYLHGCEMSCPVILQMEDGDAETLVDVSLDVLALADQYLLTDLAYYMKVLISSSLLSSDSIGRVLEFSVYHDFRDLCLDCVKKLFVVPISVLSKTNIIHELMNSGKAQILIETIGQLIDEGAKYP